MGEALKFDKPTNYYVRHHRNTFTHLFETFELNSPKAARLVSRLASELVTRFESCGFEFLLLPK